MLGSDTIGIYAMQSIPEHFQKYIKRTLGIVAESNTKRLVNRIYKQYENPIEIYTFDMVFHELLHLYFGFGETVPNIKTSHDLWFALGLGMLYDRIYFEKEFNTTSPFFQLVMDRWNQNFRLNESIEQALEQPDTSRDQENGLERLQVFGHGKALLYLQHLRTLVGKEIFDGQIQSSLQNSNFGQYSDLRTWLKETIPNFCHGENSWQAVSETVKKCEAL